MADDVIAPPYDVINSQEAYELAKDRPNSYLDDLWPTHTLLES